MPPNNKYKLEFSEFASFFIFIFIVVLSVH